MTEIIDLEHYISSELLECPEEYRAQFIERIRKILIEFENDPRAFGFRAKLTQPGHPLFRKPS